MKRVLSLILLAFMLVSTVCTFSGCGKNRYELVLLTDSGGINDRGFNQSAWDTMTEFAVQRDLGCRYFIPQSTKHEDLTSQIRTVAGDGASVIVLSGRVYETALYEVQRDYPEIKFILIDGKPHAQDSRTQDIPANTTSVMFAAEQSGFLAGYAAVCDGITNIGFLAGKPDDDARAYGYGFLQGAEYAAKENGISVSAAYQYTGDDEKNDKNKQTAKKMYEDGADLIFTCGKNIQDSVIDAAGEKRCYVICSDKDRRYDAGAVITSAVKGVSGALKLVLRSVCDMKDFEYSFGGKSTYFDAANGGAGLASFVINDKNGDAFDRFYKFNRNDYEVILERLGSKSVTVKRDINISDPSGYVNTDELTSELGLEFVKVNVLQ